MTNSARNIALTAALLLTTAFPVFAQDGGPQVAPPKPAAPKPAAPKLTAEPVRAVDVAICLDTSGSMDGLIDSAKQKLWTIVNDLALAKPTPYLRVSLVTFGNTGHLEENGWVHVQTDLTENLDLVSERLFELKTNGGTELVGRAIHTATRKLTWSKDKDALKIIVIAGNESADQDATIRYADACKDAIGRGVMVNAIYCGSPTDGVAEEWRQVARLADGHFATIDKDNGTVVVVTPFDEKLTKLSASVNRTYVPYGKLGAWNRSNQIKQDANAVGLNSEAAACRSAMKCGVNYRNDSWDLVDAMKQKGFDLAKIEDKDLPEDMRKLTLEEKKAHLEKRRKERLVIQKQVQELSKKRDAFLVEAMKKGTGRQDKAFDFAVRKAIRAQATSRGFRFVDAAVE